MNGRFHLIIAGLLIACDGHFNSTLNLNLGWITWPCSWYLVICWLRGWHGSRGQAAWTSAPCRTCERPGSRWTVAANATPLWLTLAQALKHSQLWEMTFFHLKGLHNSTSSSTIESSLIAVSFEQESELEATEVDRLSELQSPKIHRSALSLQVCSTPLLIIFSGLLIAIAWTRRLDYCWFTPKAHRINLSYSNGSSPG